MPLSVARGLLACPRCGAALAIGDRTVSCPSGHSYDVAKQGYVNLLGTAPPANADTAAMVAARERWLATGAYEPVAAAVVDAVRQHAGTALTGPVVAEVGAGTAWYLARVLDETRDSRGIALDVSPAAARRAARAHVRVASVVADTWQRLPLVDGCVDVLLCIFAPRNGAEFRRVLAPGGVLVVVHPNPGHLAELRRSSGLLDIDPDKAERLAAQLHGFELTHTRVQHQVSATADQVGDLIAMGPNAFHTGPVAAHAATVALDVSIVTAIPH